MKFGGHGGFENLGHASLLVGEGREWDTVFGSAEGGVDSEPDVVIAENVVTARVEVAIEVGAVSSSSSGWGLWSVFCAP